VTFTFSIFINSCLLIYLLPTALTEYATVSDDLCEVYLVKSKNGIYFAAIINDKCRVLVWFLDESDGKAQWVFKHGVSQHDLINTFLGQT
jgi:hypothetical protein